VSITSRNVECFFEISHLLSSGRTVMHIRKKHRLFPLCLRSVTMLSESEISSGYLLGVLFGCLSSLFFDFCFCFSVFCFCPFSLSFFPPLSPITSLLFLLSKTSSRSVVSVATTADTSLLIVILHTFQNQSIEAFRKASTPDITSTFTKSESSHHYKRITG